MTVTLIFSVPAILSAVPSSSRQSLYAGSVGRAVSGAGKRTKYGSGKNQFFDVFLAMRMKIGTLVSHWMGNIVVCLLLA